MTQTEDTTYNGWTNYETWAMALWIDNDQGSYNYARELAAGCLEAESAEGLTLTRSAAGSLADMLKGWQEELREEWEGERPACQFTDLLSAAMSEVDWYEIAENILSELS